MNAQDHRPARRLLMRRMGIGLTGPCLDFLAPDAAAAVAAAAADSTAAGDDTVARGRRLSFARDHGAHPGATIEWWYATGWLGREQAPTHGFQVTFFRRRTGLADGNPSRFAARQLLFAHAAVTDLATQRHLHAQRIARWNGDPQARPDRAARHDTAIAVGGWRLERSVPAEGHAASRWQARITDAALAFDLTLEATQPLLLQGEDGFSRKGPDARHASHYYSAPQLEASVRLRGAAPAGTRAGAGAPVPAPAARGRAWLDHEWSHALMHPEAVGWDWLGINLFDGTALTAFRLRRRDGSTLWAGGSVRPAGETAARAFTPPQVLLTPGRLWRSAATGARYPVEWTLACPAGRFALRALLDSQELDSRSSTGTVYWEGLSELLDAGGRRVGLGYLEMTGYGAALRLG